MTWWMLVVGLLVWTVASVAYFLLNLGNKNEEEDSVFAWILSPPSLLICMFIGFLGRKK